MEVRPSTLLEATTAITTGQGNLKNERLVLLNLYKYGGVVLSNRSFCLLQFSEIFKGIQHNFYPLKVHICNKNSSRKVGNLKVKKWDFLLVLFQGNYDGVPPIFRTLILTHLKGIGLCCGMFLESPCIHSFTSCYRY